MNTEKRVLAMLNKTREIKLAKKENLGAIEDAINEAQTLVDTYTSDMEATLRNLIIETDDIVSSIMGYSQQLKSIISESQSYYDEAELKFYDTVKELDALGISFNDPFPALGSDFKDAINYANTIANLDL